MIDQLPPGEGIIYRSGGPRSRRGIVVTLGQAADGQWAVHFRRYDRGPRRPRASERYGAPLVTFSLTQLVGFLAVALSDPAIEAAVERARLATVRVEDHNSDASVQRRGAA